MKFLFVAVMLFLSLSLMGQQRPGGGGPQGNPDGVVYGVVIDKESGKPIEFANIVIYSRRDSSIVTGGITDANGKFSIENVRYGRFYADIHFIGFGKQHIPELMIRPDNKTVNMGTIHLSLTAEMLGAVEIEATVDRVEYRLDRKVINVSQDINAAGGTAVDVLENVPSVQTDIDGNVSLRGTESFLILIDGRPSPIQGSDALQQIPAALIEQIEIITNPSAKFDPDGVGGIINVIMKQDRRQGYNGQINAHYGSFNTMGIDGLFNIRTKKMNFFIGGNINQGNNEGTGYSERITRLPGDTTFNLVTENDRRRVRNSSMARAGFDYYINKKDVLTVSGRYASNTFGFDLSNRSSSFMQYNGANWNDYSYLTDSYFRVNWAYFSGDINYMKKFTKPGHELQAYASYAANTKDEINLYSNRETDMDYKPINEVVDSTRTIEDGSGSTLTGKIDYTLPLFEKGKFEAGYQLRHTASDNDYRFQNVLNNEWIDDAGLINPYTFSRNVQSGYITFSNFYKKLGYMAGLRTEYTDRLFQQSITKQKWHYHKFDFFPTMHMSYQLPKEMQVMASYSRRLDRPQPWFLDPFREVVDPNNVRQGNPMLRPEYTNSMELNFQKRFNTNFVSFEAYYRGTTDKIERITLIDSLNPEVFVNTFDNIGQSLASGGEVMTNINVLKWWNLNVSGSVFYYEIKDINNTITWNARVNNTLRIKKTGTAIQISGFYNGPSITSQGERKATYSVNAGARQDFLKRKLSVSFNVRDIFQTMGHEMIEDTPMFYSYSTRSRKSPTYRIAITYNINDYKAKRERSGGDMEMERSEDGM